MNGQLVFRRVRMRGQRRSGTNRHRIFIKHFVQNLVLPPDRVDNHTCDTGIDKFAAQLARKHINDFQLWLVNAPIKMV